MKKLFIGAFVFLVLAGLAYLNLQPSDNTYRDGLLRHLSGKMGADAWQAGVKANGYQTHYFESDARASQVPLVLIHGAGEGAITWYPVFSRWSAQRTVIAPDVVGYGESKKPDAPYDPVFFSNWLASFLDAKNISKADLAGSSQGGAIVLAFAQRHPDRVRKIVLVDSAGTAPVPPLILAHFALLNTFPTRFLQEYSLAYLVSNASSVDPDWIDYGVQVLRMPGGKNPFWQGQGKAASLIDPATLGRIQTPALILWGENDSFFPLAYGKEMAGQLPRSHFETIPNAGHLPFFDQPENFANIVTRFLNAS